MQLESSCHARRWATACAAVGFASATAGHLLGMMRSDLSSIAFAAMDTSIVAMGVVDLASTQFACTVRFGTGPKSFMSQRRHEWRVYHVAYFAPLARSLMSRLGTCGELIGEALYRAAPVGGVMEMWYSKASKTDLSLAALFALSHALNSRYLHFPLQWPLCHLIGGGFSIGMAAVCGAQAVEAFRTPIRPRR